MTTVPTHEYKSTEGSEAAPFGQHEARTVEHKVTNPNPDSIAAQATELYLMIEIGDGVFVQIGSCDKCGKRVSECGCAGGPVPPEYVGRWRNQRFERSFNERPEPTLPEIPSVVKYLKERGYTVAKKGKAEPEEPEVDAVVEEALVETEPDLHYEPTERDKKFGIPGVGKTDNEGVDPQKVDAGLDEALDKVRAAKLNADDFPDDF